MQCPRSTMRARPWRTAGWAAVQLCCCKSSGGRSCGADSQGREAERSSDHAFRQVRVCDQSQNRRTDSPRSLIGRLKWARSAARKLKIVACNVSQTRTPYSRSRNRDLDSKRILTRAGISSLERKSGYQVTRVRISYIERKRMTKFKFLHAVAILSMMIATQARANRIEGREVAARPWSAA